MSNNESPTREHEQNDDGRPTKRRRVALACKPCRERKSRCDGETPVCAACSQQGSECSYAPPLSKTEVVRQELTSMVRDLQGRVEDLERILSSRASATLPGATELPVSRQSDTISPVEDLNGAGIIVQENAFRSTSSCENTADGIGIVPLTSREDFAFFGPSSNIAFLRLVSRALSKTSRAPSSSRLQTNTTSRQTTYSNGASKTTSAPRSPQAHSSRRSEGTFALPEDSKMRELISCYFVNCGHVHPYLHEGRFMETYEEVKRSGFKSVRRSWLALLYIVLALAGMSWPHSGSTLAHVNAESEEWYEAASDLSLRQVFVETGVNLEIVQCLLLMVMYLQSTHSSAKPSYILSLAIKMGYSLGLHSAEASRAADPIEAELRKRTWYGMRYLDRTLSMTVGRPAEIPTDTPALGHPQPFTDSVRRGCLWQDECAVGFFDANLSLYEHLHNIVDTLYCRNSGIRMSFTLDSIAKIYSLENNLLKWKRELEPRLAIMQPDELPSDSTHFEETLEFFTRRQRTILTLRYLNARIFVHRPILEGLLEAITWDQSELQHLRMMRQSGANSVKVVVSCALQSIALVHRLIVGTTHGHQQLGAWWFSLYYNFHSSLAILGSFSVSQPRWDCAEILTAEDMHSASRALQLSLEILDGLDDDDGGHPTVIRCRQYLQNLIRIAEPLQAQRSASTATGMGGLASPSYETTPGSSFQAQHVPGMMDMSQIGQFPSDLDLQSFLFPLDMNGFGGQLIGTDQPFL